MFRVHVPWNSNLGFGDSDVLPLVSTTSASHMIDDDKLISTSFVDFICFLVLDIGTE